ncbi:MAG: hypothetical protein MJE66_14425 [Proteobacteria bacterium]|nr:hypothetical protein [Pseudomonadota bacterium]
MPIDYRIDAARKVLVAEGHGQIRDEDLLDYARRMFADPGRHLAAHELVDLTRASDDSEITADGIRELAEYWRGRYDLITGGRLAIVANSEVAYGLARMYQLMRDDGPDRIRVFRSLDEAWEWLES